MRPSADCPGFIVRREARGVHDLRIQILRGCFRIAVIEGDSLMRELASRWLSDAGHAVVLLAERQRTPVPGLDLVMLDLANPGRASGRVEALRALHQAPVMVVSTHQRKAPQPSPLLARRVGAAAILPKPYTRDELLAAVASACGASGGGREQ